MNERIERRRMMRVWWGVMLIAFGILLLVQQYGLFRIPGWVYIGVPGLVFAIAYGLSRNHGFLIPAGILLGLTGGIALEGERASSNGVAVIGGLGLGFIAIYVVDWLVTRRASWWPLIPGGILVVIAALLGTGNASLLQWLDLLWPLALILGGAAVLYQFWREQSTRDKPS